MTNPTHLFASLVCMIMLSACADTRAAEPGWVSASKLNGVEPREYLRDAMRQKKNQAHFIEHRWIQKPTGAFQEIIAVDYAPASHAKRETRTKLGTNEMDHYPKYLGREWYLVIRTLIVVDRQDPKAADLISEASLASLTTQLGGKIEQIPMLLGEKPIKSFLFNDFSKEPASMYQERVNGLSSDQVMGSSFGGFTKAPISPFRSTRLAF